MISNKIFEMSRPTFLENWPKELYKLSIFENPYGFPLSIGLPLSFEQMGNLRSNILELGESPKKPINDIINRIDEQIAINSKFRNNGVFVKLGSRSPKDSWLGKRKGFKVKSGVRAVELLCDCSERIYEDLTMAIDNNYNAHIWLRQWVNITKWAEFRCFMKDRELVGVSQYHYNEHFVELEKWIEDVHADIGHSNQSSIETFKEVYILPYFKNHFEPLCHLDSVVFDIFIDRECLNEPYRSVNLIELNPFCSLTDPCLFNWKSINPINPTKEGDFDGSFRFVREQDKIDDTKEFLNFQSQEEV